MSDYRSAGGSTDHETPDGLFDAINAYWGPIDFDACAAYGNAKLQTFITENVDAFEEDWSELGKVAFMNPPYGRGIGRWLKLARQWSEQGITVICLIPSSVGTKWWAEYVSGKASEVVFLTGRVKFIRDGQTGGAPFDSAVVVYRPPFEWPHWTPG